MRSALKLIFAMRPSWKVCGEAEDGRDAVTKASELRPDLIVLDFKMPFFRWCSGSERDFQEHAFYPNDYVHALQDSRIGICRQTGRSSICGRQRGWCFGVYYR